MQVSSASIFLSDKKGELEQEEDKSVDSLPQALSEEKVQDFSLPQDSQEIQDLGNEESLKTDNSDDSNDDDHDSDRTEKDEQDLAQEHVGKLFKLGHEYVKNFFGEMGLKLSKRNFGHIMHRFDPRAAVNFGRLNKDELKQFNKEARVFILQARKIINLNEL